MSASEFLPLIVTILSAGGLAGAVVALLKLRPESGAIVVTAAQGALIVQSGVIDALQEENKRLRDRVGALEAQLAVLRDDYYNGRGRQQSST